MNNMNKPILSCSHLKKAYVMSSDQEPVLNDINFELYTGETVAILGPSGSGKSTLLHILGGLDLPTEGEVMLFGKDWRLFSERQRCQERNLHLGFIYQFHHILPEFTALENVMVPLVIRGDQPIVAQKKAKAILEHVGLGARTHHKLAQLSGGERQRTAVARALVSKPSCVLADEPTGNLDHKTALHVIDTMLKLNQEMNTSLIIVTHDLNLAQKTSRILKLEDGQLIQC